MNVAAPTRLITTYVVAKRAQVSRFSVDRRSIASQPTETRTRTRLVSFVAWARSNVTAASVSSPARLTDRAALAAAAVARSERPIHVICSGSAFERVEKLSTAGPERADSRGANDACRRGPPPE